MVATDKILRDALRAVKDPELGLDLVVLGLVYDIEVTEANVKATISLTSPLCPAAAQIVDDATQARSRVWKASSAPRSSLPSPRPGLPSVSVR